MSTVVEAENLHKSYRNRRLSVAVLTDVNFCLRQGELLMVNGKNGSGKSTLVRLLAGIAAPTAGKLHIYDTTPLEARQRHAIGVLFEGDRSFYWRLTVAENLKFFAAIWGGAYDLKTNVLMQQLIEAWAFEKAMSQRYEALSFGERKKVGLLRALSCQAKLLLLDDPCNSLDSSSIATLNDGLKQLKSEGTTIVIASPDTDHLDELVDKRLELKA